jgi:septal ring factor EnvC (AmiA/AmiB activator)
VNDLIPKAEMSVEQFLPMLIGALVAALGFFLSRAFTSSDSSRKDIADINQAIGLLNAAKDRAKEEDDRLRKNLEKMEDDVRELRDRVLMLERDQGACE